MSGKKHYSQAARVQGIFRKEKEESKGKMEKEFVDDLIVYLNYKIREAERIRTERRQLTFWCNHFSSKSKARM